MNSLYLYQGDWGTWYKGILALITKSSIIGLRLGLGKAHEIRKYCEVVTKSSSISLISVEDNWRNTIEICIANMRCISNIVSNMATDR
jgi:hypothetical protein